MQVSSFPQQHTQTTPCWHNDSFSCEVPLLSDSSTHVFNVGPVRIQSRGADIFTRCNEYFCAPGLVASHTHTTTEHMRSEENSVLCVYPKAEYKVSVCLHLGNCGHRHMNRACTSSRMPPRHAHGLRLVVTRCGLPGGHAMPDTCVCIQPGDQN